VAIVGITPKLVERLLKAYPNAVAGMKDSSGDWNNTKMFLDAFAESDRPVGDSPWRVRPGFDVFVGSESFLLANMRNGGVGTISATANVNAAAIYRLYEKFSRVCAALAAANASTSDLEEQQARLNVVREIFSSKKFPSMIAAVKQAIGIYTDDPEWSRVRPPLVELTAAQAKLLAKQLQRFSVARLGMERATRAT